MHSPACPSLPCSLSGLFIWAGGFHRGPRHPLHWGQNLCRGPGAGAGGAKLLVGGVMDSRGHCRSLVVVPPPSCHQSGRPSIITALPSPRLASSVSRLCWHPFANAGLNCFCGGLNPDSRPSTHPAPQPGGVPGSQKGLGF